MSLSNPSYPSTLLTQQPRRGLKRTASDGRKSYPSALTTTLNTSHSITLSGNKLIHHPSSTTNNMYNNYSVAISNTGLKPTLSSCSLPNTMESKKLSTKRSALMDRTNQSSSNKSTMMTNTTTTMTNGPHVTSTLTCASSANTLKKTNSTLQKILSYNKINNVSLSSTAALPIKHSQPTTISATTTTSSNTSTKTANNTTNVTTFVAKSKSPQPQSSRNTTTSHTHHPSISRNIINDAMKVVKAKSNARLRGVSTTYHNLKNQRHSHHHQLRSQSNIHPSSTKITSTTISNTATKSVHALRPHSISTKNVNKSNPIINSSDFPNKPANFASQNDLNKQSTTCQLSLLNDETKTAAITAETNRNSFNKRYCSTEIMRTSPDKKRKHSSEDDTDDHDVDMQPAGVVHERNQKLNVDIHHHQYSQDQRMNSLEQTEVFSHPQQSNPNAQQKESFIKKKTVSEGVQNQMKLYSAQEAKENSSRVSEYEDDIFEYMHELDRKTMVNPNYMSIQVKIDWSMRSILVDWLIQVHRRFTLLPETIFLCVNLVDRFLSTKVVSVEKFQLLGITCLFIACKYEEEQCPTVSDLVYMVDNCYTAEEIITAERFVLNQLKYEIGYPGPLNFMRRISKADGYESKIRTLCKYLVEVTLMDERFLMYPCSLLAAAGMYLARRILYEKPWTIEHIKLSGYQEHEMIDCARLMLNIVGHPSKHHAIFEKYQDLKYLAASTYMQEYLAHIQQICH